MVKIIIVFKTKFPAHYALHPVATPCNSPKNVPFQYQQKHRVRSAPMPMCGNYAAGIYLYLYIYIYFYLFKCR